MGKKNKKTKKKNNETKEKNETFDKLMSIFQKKEEQKKPPVVKIVDKKAIVDQYFEDRNLYHVYEDKENIYNGNIFSCTLNKSDLDKNNNKFYIIQLLEHDKDNSLVLFTRWGRVGLQGLHERKGVDESSGPKLFMKKYKEKTKKHDYQEIYIDYGAEVEKEDLPDAKKSIGDKKEFKTTLSYDVMELMRLIYNKNMINDN